MAKRTTDSFENDARQYADASVNSIREMVQALEHSQECDGEMDCSECDGTGSTSGELPGECATCNGTGKTPCTEGKDSDNAESWHDADKARERIEEDALSIEVRSDWYTPGDSEGQKPSEYAILITTGGPAARIVGDLDNYGQPTSARFEYQDWFKPWTEVYRDSSDSAVLLTYARQFYFGA